MALTSYERETVFNMSDGDDVVRIWSAQATVIRRCRKNDAFTEVSSGTEDGTEWAEFTIAKKDFRFSSKRKSNMSDERKAELAARLAAHRAGSD